MEDYWFDDDKTPKNMKISDDNKISKYSYINIYEKDDVYRRKIRKTIMENLQIKHYIKIGETCSICLDEIWRRKEAYLTDCGHSFHLKCILQYDFSNSFEKYGVFCPLCRKDMGNYLERRDDFEYKLPKICYNIRERCFNNHFYLMRYKDCSYCRL